MAISRRFRQFKLQLVDRNPVAYARELQEFLKDLWDQALGIPGGFLSSTPTTIKAGVAGSSGTAAAGWQAADSTPPIETGPPTGTTGVTASEGGGTALMRADATIPDAVLLEAAAATDGYGLVADSTQALGIRFIPALSSSEVEYFKTVFLESGGAGAADRGADRSAQDLRFASDRRGRDTLCCTLPSTERGYRC